MSLKVLFLSLFLTLNLFAVEGKVKVFIPSQASIYTSQKITVSVELLSSAFSITDAKITFPASAKYIIQAPKSAAYLGQEEVNGEDWQMVHYDYAVYALQAGKIEIPSVSVSFTASMGYGQPQKEFALQSDALSFDVKSPGGLEKQGFVLVTDAYDLSSEVEPEKKRLIIGDAVTLKVTQKAHAVPDILLRPIRYSSNALLRVYEKEPKLQSNLKGKYDVSRTDSFTFLASAEGSVTLPAKNFVWWNSQTKKLEVEKIDAFSFVIIEDPQIAIDERNDKIQKYLLAFLLFALVMFLIYWKFFGVIKKYSGRIKAKYRARKKPDYTLTKKLNP